jgi:hypothetical protein
MTIADIIGTWIPIIMIIVIFSFAFGDNPFWQFAETIAIGSGLGNYIVYNWSIVQRTAIQPLLQGSIISLVPLILGIALYTRFIPKYDWIARYGFVWMIAGTLGVGVGSVFQGTILPNLAETMMIIQPTMEQTIWKSLMFIMFVTTWSYFFFTREQTGVLGISSRIGRVFMMASLGVGYACMIEEYSMLVIERLWFVYKTLGIMS